MGNEPMNINLSGIERNRWERGIAHDPRSERIARALGEIDLHGFDDHFCWKFGGDGDNGESLMYELDVYFELLDKGKLPTPGIRWKDKEFVRELLEALKAYKRLDEFHDNCPECGGMEQPEACARCFPLADDARIKMRSALGKEPAA